MLDKEWIKLCIDFDNAAAEAGGYVVPPWEISEEEREEADKSFREHLKKYKESKNT